MGRSPCCDESGLKKGPWTTEEDDILVKYIQRHGHGSWRALPKLAGLNRCGKSCRLRWTNYLRPDIKRGKFSPEEEQTILNLHAILGNKWSAIASHLPGRTDNEIKNFWNTHLKKKLIQMGFDPMTHQPRTDLFSSLPQLLALATLKDLVVDHHHSIEERAARLQAEAAIAKLQYLQLLQTPSNYDLSLLAATANNASNNHTNAHLNSFMDIETLKLLASLVQSPDNPILPVGPGPNNITTPLHQNFGSPHLPEMQQQNNSSCSFQEQTTVKEIDSNTVFHVEASELNSVLNQELNTPSSPWQLPPLSSTDALISNQSLDESSNWNYDWSNSILEDSFISETDRP